MKKNDITYEYRVFTNRLIDVESMEVGNCTSKVIKEIKSKDKVDGRFFHTSDTDEWFYCWNGELQKLNLKGNSDVNNALAEVKKLIGEANAAVNEAKVIAKDAADAADAATKAAEDANTAVESIENKADKSEVDAVSKAVEAKAEKAVVDELVQTVADKAEQSAVEELAQAVEEKANQSVVDELSAKVDAIPSMEEIALKSDLDGYVKLEDMPTIPSLDGYATEEFVLNKIAEAELNDKDVDLSNYVTKSDIANFVTKDEVPSVEGLASEQYVIDRINEINIPSVEGLATTTYVDEKVAEIKVPSIDNLATKEEIEGVKTWVNEQGFLTEHQDLSDYAKKEDLPSVEGLATETFVMTKIAEAELNDKEVDLSGYATKEDIANLASKEEVAAVVEGYATETWVNEQGFLTEHQDITGKQDVIEDLESIRSGAAAGATALQVIPEEYVTETELNNKGYLTEQSLNGYATESFVSEEIKKIVIPDVPNMDNYYTKGDIDTMIGNINTMIGQATEITNTILNA